MERAPTDRGGEGGTRSDDGADRGGPPEGCYCTWQLCPLGPDGESCIVFLRVGGGWWPGACSWRPTVVAGGHAPARRRRSAAGLEDPPLDSPRSNTSGLVSKSGDHPRPLHSCSTCN